MVSGGSITNGGGGEEIKGTPGGLSARCVSKTRA